MKNFEELKRLKIIDMACRMENLMYENYYGGDIIIVKNVILTIDHDLEKYGMGTTITNKTQHFTNGELYFIEKENILDEFREVGWNIEIKQDVSSDAGDSDITWIFTKAK